MNKIRAAKMIRIVLIFLVLTTLHSSGDSVHQIVSPNSVATVRLPTIKLGDRSGVRMVVGRQESKQGGAFEEGSGEAFSDSSSHSRHDLAYISSNFEGNLNTWSLNGYLENSSKSLCYNPVRKEV